jgi:L-alanine-DL-glutamate epimerase-like enolase superfamily enzyme
MAGWGNLQVMGATSEDTSEWYEKGLLAPGVDYDAAHPYLRRNCDPMDADGMIALPDTPGLGYEIVWDYINDNRLET